MRFNASTPDIWTPETHRGGERPISRFPRHAGADARRSFDVESMIYLWNADLDAGSASN
jgi:hypothetical protein